MSWAYKSFLIHFPQKDENTHNQKIQGGCNECMVYLPTWMFPKIGVPQNWWCIMEHPINMDDLGVPLFSETSTFTP